MPRFRRPRRLLLSNPDSIGDMTLREPLYRALTNHGDEMLLLINREVEPVARRIAPRARLVAWPARPYGLSAASPHDALAPAIEAAREFDPDLIVIAPWHWTMAEEHLVRGLPDVPVVGLSGELWQDLGVASKIRFQTQVPAERNLHETDKAHLLAEHLTGAPLAADRPRLSAGSEQVDRARAALAKHAWSEGYWIAAVGQIPGQRYSALRNWPAEKWASALSHAIRRHGWRFVFAGTPDEQTFSRKVLDLLGPDAGSVLLQPDGDLDLLLGMIALSDGYFGRDCGPMHLAAALGKPVVAVFGGGAWPRFSPRGDCTWTVTIGVPCVGCYWHCCVGDSYCIKDTPVAAVTAALDEAAAGHGSGQRLNVLACEPALAERIAREAAQTARDLSRQLHERSFAAQARKATLVARLPPTIARFLHRRLGRGDHQSS